jgi:hypothetical protein
LNINISNNNINNSKEKKEKEFEIKKVKEKQKQKQKQNEDKNNYNTPNFNLETIQYINHDKDNDIYNDSYNHNDNHNYNDNNYKSPEKILSKKFDSIKKQKTKEDNKDKKKLFICDEYFSLSRQDNYSSTELFNSNKNEKNEKNEIRNFLQNLKNEEGNKSIKQNPVELVTVADLDEISFSQFTRDYNENPRNDISSLINFDENSMRVEIAKINLKLKYNDYLDKFFPKNLNIYFKDFKDNYKKNKITTIMSTEIKDKSKLKKKIYKINPDFLHYLRKFHSDNKCFIKNSNKDNSFDSNFPNNNNNNNNSLVLMNSNLNLNLNNSIYENKILNCEEFYKKIPKLYSEYITLEYQSTELLNEVFEIYENFVFNLTKKEKNKGRCIVSPKKNRDKENRK